jgi:hypothetical protein
MNPTTAAIELTAAPWEQWVGAVLRTERFRALMATARPRRRLPAPAKTRPQARSSLVWMLAVSVAGFWVLG